MSQRAGKLPQSCHPAQMRQLALLFLNHRFGPLPIGHVANDDDVAGLACHLHSVGHEDEAEELAGLGSRMKLEITQATLCLQNGASLLIFSFMDEEPELLGRAPERLRPGMPEHRLPLLVYLEIPVVRLPDDHDGVRAGVERLAEAVLRAAQ